MPECNHCRYFVLVLTIDQRISLVIPTSAAMAFVPVLFVSQPLQAKLICLLSISSLICTAYILIFIPNSRAEPANHKQPMTISQSTTGPIHRYISYLNGGLSILILLNALKFKNQQGVHESFWVLCIVPSGEPKLRMRQHSSSYGIVVLLIIVTVKRLMRAVDLSELEALRYEYKGA